jgi:tripeptidyl-peptidase-1
MLLVPLCVLAGLLAFASAHPQALVKHSLPDIPSGWIQLSDAPSTPSRGLNLRFGLVQHGFSHLESLLLNISDPSHPSYGNHLSKEQVHALSKPSNNTLKLVEDWLATHNARSVKWSSSQDSVTAVVPVSSAESMLSTRFGVFEHAKSGKRVVRTLSYSLPEDLVPHIDYVHPTTAFFDPLRHGMGKFSSEELSDTVAIQPHLDRRPVALNQSDFPSCVRVVDPPCVRKLYNIGNYTPAVSVHKNNRIGVSVLFLIPFFKLTSYRQGWVSRHMGQAVGLIHVVESSLKFDSDSLELYLNDYIPESIGSNYTMDVVNITGRSISICCVLL